MRTTILTFQFAHNYGALLQAYALKKFVSLNGNETTIAPYYPEWAQAEYAISPNLRRKRMLLTINTIVLQTPANEYNATFSQPLTYSINNVYSE